MYTIKRNYISEMIIKNSKFITLLYKIDNPDIVNSILEKIKNDYPDATHYCYGFVSNNIKKSSDDGEPSGTAGIPVLKVLEANDLNNVLAVVVRYFGGIKLGANGLIRAYTKAVAAAIQESGLTELIKGLMVDIIFNYKQIKNVDYLLKDITINNKSFDNLITYNISIPIAFTDVLKNNHIEYKIIKEIYIEK